MRLLFPESCERPGDGCTQRLRLKKREYSGECTCSPDWFDSSSPLSCKVMPGSGLLLVPGATPLFMLEQIS